MKRIFLPVAFLLAVACQDEPTKKESTTKPDSAVVTTPAPAAAKPDVAEPVISERIDGPANIRAAANGKTIYSLDHNIPVTAREPEKGWMEIGVWVDLDNPDQKMIKKDAVLKRDGKPIGKALEDIHLYETITVNEKKRGVINGFTAVNNIQAGTILENAFAEYLADKSTVKLDEIKPLLDTYRFEDFNGLEKGNTGFVFYESNVLDPTAQPRFWPVFNNNKELVLIFHGRKMEVPGASTEAFEGGYVTVFSKDVEKVKKLKQKFKIFMQSAG
ncbi:MAG: hypothetical protein ACTHMC_03300 [Pseudobacter sp.]|uniref:hypothetical protein n=1 Tax=Pseudobacter sp. TaxID=2045420 RepID=UPI003F7F69D8